MFSLLAKLLALLPLTTLHRLGKWLGLAVYACTPASTKILRDNLTQSALFSDKATFDDILKSNISEAGKAMLETLAIWQKPEAELLTLVTKVYNWQVVESALSANKGIIFLTPHLGCFEITSIYYGAKHPITVLYRPPKAKWLESLILRGRTRKGVSLAEANASGVRKLIQALKRNEAIGILPDQIPKAGEGEWADFFGKPAYTMTLASKLAVKTGATVIMGFGERLKNGAGYALHLNKVDSIATPTLLNKAIEQQIAQKPSQYLWSYNRYKVRSHALIKHHNRTINPD